MHPPRRSNLNEVRLLADGLADWLMARCPFTSLTALILVVTAPLAVPRPAMVLIPAVVADLAVVVVRRRRWGRQSRPWTRQSHPEGM